MSTTTVWLTALIAYIAVSYVSQSSKVGECRSECLEVGVFPIVRVHLKAKTVHAGICVNETNGKIRSRIYPFYCEKKVGKWKPDEEDNEGIVAFSKPCPTATSYSERVIGTCP